VNSDIRNILHRRSQRGGQWERGNSPKNPRLAEHRKPKAGRPYSICTLTLNLSRENRPTPKFTILRAKTKKKSGETPPQTPSSMGRGYPSHTSST